MPAVDLRGDWFRVILFREREDLYRFTAEEIGGFTRVTGQVSSGNERETSVKAIGEVTGLASAGTVVTFKINGRAFMFTSDRHVTLWSRSTDEDGRAGDTFDVYMGENTPFRKLKEPSFFLHCEHVDGRVNYCETNDPECESIGMSDFELFSPYGPNGHPWFSNDPVEQIKFDEAAPKPPERKKTPKNNDLFNDDPGFFMRKK